MKEKPKCVIITGRPGSGKTTLADKLSKKIYFPKISRDELKEGYVNTFGVKHDELPEDTNRIVNEIFFKTILDLLSNNVSLVVEAAFQHKLWDKVIPKISEIAKASIIICDLSAELSAKRHIERGLSDSTREYYHGDKKVSIYRETGELEAGEEYIPPQHDIRKLEVSTVQDYSPSINEIIGFFNEGN